MLRYLGRLPLRASTALRYLRWAQTKCPPGSRVGQRLIVASRRGIRRDAGLTQDGVAPARAAKSSALTAGAGHDAQMMARIRPAAMIFVPSAGGISRNPREHASVAELEGGLGAVGCRPEAHGHAE